MAGEQRFKDRDWCAGNEGELYESIKDGAFLAIAMDIRNELRRIRSILECHNAQTIPLTLNRIARNTAKPRKKRAAR